MGRGSQEYLLEAMDSKRRWYILGSEPTSARAQHAMRKHRQLFPKDPLRVVEHPSRRLQVLHDPQHSNQD